MSIKNTTVLFHFEDDMDFDSVDAILRNVKPIVEKEELQKTVAKRIMHVVIETTDNLFRHSRRHHSDSRKHKLPIFELSKDEENFYITVGNQVNPGEIDNLQAKIDSINHLSKEELKELYKHTITHGFISERGGAGLGFIDIRLKSGNSIDYKFEPLNDGNAFYVLNISIPKIANKELA